MFTEYMATMEEGFTRRPNKRPDCTSLRTLTFTEHFDNDAGEDAILDICKMEVLKQNGATGFGFVVTTSGDRITSVSCDVVQCSKLTSRQGHDYYAMTPIHDVIQDGNYHHQNTCFLFYTL